MRDDTTTLTAGTRIGAHRIAGFVGRLHGASVYRAEELSTGRSVLIRFLDGIVASALARELRELEVIARIEMPGLVPIEQLDVRARPPYVVLGELRAPSLRVRRARSGVSSIDEARRIAIAILDVLAELHGRGIVHGDVRPDTVVVDDDGRVRLDACLIRDTDPRSLDRPRRAPFASPEAKRRERVDARTDLFSLGATLRFALGGRDHDRGPIRTGDAALDELVDRLGRVDRRERFVSAEEALRTLDALCGVALPAPTRRGVLLTRVEAPVRRSASSSSWTCIAPSDTNGFAAELGLDSLESLDMGSVSEPDAGASDELDGAIELSVEEWSSLDEPLSSDLEARAREVLARATEPRRVARPAARAPGHGISGIVIEPTAVSDAGGSSLDFVTEPCGPPRTRGEMILEARRGGAVVPQRRRRRPVAGRRGPARRSREVESLATILFAAAAVLALAFIGGGLLKPLPPHVTQRITADARDGSTDDDAPIGRRPRLVADALADARREEPDTTSRAEAAVEIEIPIDAGHETVGTATLDPAASDAPGPVRELGAALVAEKRADPTVPRPAEAAPDAPAAGSEERAPEDRGSEGRSLWPRTFATLVSDHEDVEPAGEDPRD